MKTSVEMERIVSSIKLKKKWVQSKPFDEFSTDVTLNELLIKQR